MPEEYISIKEFASTVGISLQAIYKRLSTDLQPFVQLVEGKKMLNIKAFDLFVFNRDSTKVENNSTPVEREIIDTMQKTITALTAQLEAKDMQIAELNERLREAMDLNRNNQILLGVEQQAAKRGWLKRLFNRT
jgi:SMC interacting uncharacterized protein involved in chromosome segregation